MNTAKRFMYGVFLLAIPMLLFPALSYSDSPLSAWIGAWTLVDDPVPDRVNKPDSLATVEIRPAAGGKGLEIIWKSLDSSQKDAKDVKEVLILDGSKQTLDAKDCSGWQSSKWIPETGVIIGSSEVNCKETGSFRTSSLKAMLAADQMVDILGIKTGGQIHVATRRINFDHELLSSNEFYSGLSGKAARIAAAAPWNLDGILHLSEVVEDQVLQAALVEKRVELPINTKSLRQMKASKLSKDTIDLLVALAFPKDFLIRSAAMSAPQAAPQTTPRYTPGSSGAYYLPDPHYYPGYLNNSWLYYNYPYWYDNYLFYPTAGWHPGGVYIIGSSSGGGPTPSHGKMTDKGYTQSTPTNSGRYATPRNGSQPSSGSGSGAYANTAPVSTGSSGSTSSAPSSSGSSSAPAASSGSSSSSGSSAPSPNSGGGSRSAVPR